MSDSPADTTPITDATLRITAEHQLDRVMQVSVDLARELANARYAALGLVGPDGRLAQFVHSGLDENEAVKIGDKPSGRGVLKLLLTRLEPLRLPDISGHPHAVGFPAHHPPMRSLLGVPLTSRGNLLGSLYLTDKIGAREFSESDEKKIQTLAQATAVAIENAHLIQRVHRQAVLEERERIGMDLHDGIIQSIYAVGLSLELGRMVVRENSTETEEHIVTAIQGLDSIIRDIRSYIMDLQPARIQDGPLTDALEQLVREFRANTLVRVNLEVASDIETGLSDNCRLALFHITQEALANVAKHAHASTVNVKLDRLHNWLVLNIEDDGAGFESENIGGIPGHGLSNMSLRTRTLGGDLTVTSAPGEGTSVQAVIPLHAPIDTPPRLVSFP